MQGSFERVLEIHHPISHKRNSAYFGKLINLPDIESSVIKKGISQEVGLFDLE